MSADPQRGERGGATGEVPGTGRWGGWRSAEIRRRRSGPGSLLLAIALSSFTGCASPLRDRSAVMVTGLREAHLAAYIVAWNNADIDLALSVLSENFTVEDPDYGVISREQYPAYFDRLRRAVANAGGARRGRPYLESEAIALHHGPDESTGWLHWTFPGTPFEGVSRLRIGDEGLLSEEIFNRSPGRIPAGSPVDRDRGERAAGSLRPR